MDILIKPIVSEKMTDIQEKLNQYGFIVDKRANKIQIKKAIEDLYSVTVESVNTNIYGGKRRQRHTKAGIVKGKTNSYKKAIVSLVDGDIIDFYSNI